MHRCRYYNLKVVLKYRQLRIVRYSRKRSTNEYIETERLIRRQNGVDEERLCRLAGHQLSTFFNLGLIVAELPGDDLHPTSDFLFQTGLALTFGATLAAGGPLDTAEVIGRARLLIRFRAGGLLFGCDSLGFGWGVL